MHHKLVAMVYRGRYVRVSIFARKYREEQSLVGSTSAFFPLREGVLDFVFMDFARRG